MYYVLTCLYNYVHIMCICIYTVQSYGPTGMQGVLPIAMIRLQIGLLIEDREEYVNADNVNTLTRNHARSR